MATRKEKYQKTGTDTDKGRKAMGSEKSKKPKIRRPGDRLREIIGSFTTPDRKD